jgi:hypothetical protein
MARVNEIEAAVKRFRVNELDGRELPFAHFWTDRHEREKREAEPALDHALGGFDGVDFESDIRYKSGVAEQATCQGPIT